MPNAIITAIMFVGNLVMTALPMIEVVFGISGATYFVTGALAITAGVVGMSKLMEMSIPRPDSNYARQKTVRSTTAPVKRVYGESLISGPVAFMGVGGTGNQDLWHVIALTGDKSESISDIYLDNIIIPNADINSGNALGGAVNGTTTIFKPIDSTTLVTVYKYTGGQTAVSQPVASEFFKWTSDHEGQGLTYIATKFSFPDNEKIAEIWNKYNPQDIKALVKGMAIYDPRKDSTSPEYDSSLGVSTQRLSDSTTWQWSDNPALCLANYIADDQFGMGVPSSAIDWAAVHSSADYADALVSIPGSQTQKRFTCNGVLYGTDSHAQNINKILSSMNGSLVYSSGKYVMQAGQYIEPESDAILTDDDLNGPINITVANTRDDRFNTIKGTHFNPQDLHKKVAFPEVQLTDIATRDAGEVLYKEVELPMTNDVYMCQRLTYQMINRSNDQLLIEFPCNLKALRYTVGDRVKITLDKFAGSDQDSISFNQTPFVILGFNFSAEGAVTLTMLKDTQANYTDMPAGNYSTIASDGSITDGFSGVPAPTNLGSVVDGHFVRLTWDNPVPNTTFNDIIVYQSDTSNFSDSSIFIRTKNDALTFSLPSSALTKYYWVRASLYDNEVAATDIIIGQTYRIRNLGTTSWTTLGATAPVSNGDTFLATSSGTSSSGTGIATDESAVSAVVGPETVTTTDQVADSVEWIDVDDTAGRRPSDNATVGATLGTNVYDGQAQAYAVGDLLNSNGFFRFTRTSADDNVDAPANAAAFNTAFGRAPTDGDIVVVTNTTSSPNKQAAYQYDGSTFGTISGFFAGDLIIDDTITASALSVDNLGAITANLGSVTVGSIGNSVTVGGTAASTVASEAAAGNQAADQISLLPRADDSEWTVGTGGKGIWNVNGEYSENAVVVENGPHGELERIWKATSTDGSGADGGFQNTSTANMFPIESDTAYRFSVFIKQDNTNGTVYLGAYNYGSNGLATNLYRYDGDSPTTNRYWFANDLPTQGEWYLLVGFINPSNTNSNSGKGGIYNLATGVKVTAFDDFRFSGDGSETDATTFAVRTYNYYGAASPTSIVRWAHPRVDRLDRRAPSIAELLRGWTSLAEPINAGVTITGGGITMNSGGAIKGGQSAYNSGTGFFLGYDTNAYKFSIGNTGNNSLTFDGTNLAVTGAITATSGTFTGTVNASAGEFTGSVSIGSNGAIYGGTMDSFNDGSGFFLGYETGAYKLSVGNSSGEVLTWDGSKLNVEANTVSFMTGNEQVYSSVSRLPPGVVSATRTLVSNSDYFYFDSDIDVITPAFVVSYNLGALTSGSVSGQSNSRNAILSTIKLEMFYAAASYSGTPGTWTLWDDSTFTTSTLGQSEPSMSDNTLVVQQVDLGGGNWETKLLTREQYRDYANDDYYSSSFTPNDVVDDEYFLNWRVQKADNIEWPAGTRFIKIVATVTNGSYTPYPATGSPSTSETRVVSIPGGTVYQQENHGLAIALGGQGWDHATRYLGINGQTVMSGGEVIIGSPRQNIGSVGKTAKLKLVGFDTDNGSIRKLSAIEFHNGLSTLNGSPEFGIYVPNAGDVLAFAGNANFNNNVDVDGTLSINGVTVNAGAVTGPAGSNTQVQFNNNGALGASSDFTFNDSTDTLTVKNLTVSGTTTTVNTDNLTVKDPNITLNYSTGDSSSTANNSGITIQDAVSATADASILWKTASDTFEFSHGASINGRLTTDSVTIDDDGSGSPLLKIQADDSSPWAIQFENSAFVSPNTGNLRGYLNHGNGFFYWLHQKDFGDDSYPSTVFQFNNGTTTHVGLSLTATAASFGGAIVAAGNISISKTVPILIINDTDATTPTNQVAYISFQRQGTEKAWIGYGGSSDDTFKIRNTEGPITINGPTDSLNLDVLGNVRLGQSTVNTFMYINGGETSTGAQDREAGIIWQKGGSQKWETYVESGSNHYYKFYSYTDSQEVLQLRNDGDVQAPNGQFIAENFMFEGVSGKIRFGGTGDDGDYLLLGDVSSGSNSFALVQDSATKISVDGVTGNFGVLTATPKATIDVAQSGNDWEDGILIRHNAGDTGWNIHAEDNTANELWFGYNADTSLALTSQTATNLMQLSSLGYVKITGASDYQLALSGGTSSWAGIKFSDTDSNDNFWYKGLTSTFAIGGGGSTAVGKKLHVDGRTSIGDGFDNLTTASQLYVYEPADSPSGTSGTLSSVISVAARTDAAGDGASVDFVSVWGGADQYQHTAVNAGWVTARVGGVYDSAAGNGGALVFYTNSGTSATSGSTYANLTEKMRIKPNGEIHVGGTKVIDQARNATFTSLTTPVLDGNLVYLTNAGTPTNARFQIDVEGVASQQALYTYWYDGTSYNARTSIGGNDGNYFNVSGEFRVGGVKAMDSVGNFFGKTQTLVGASGTSVIESIRNPNTSWSQYALTRYGTEAVDTRYMDFGYFRGASEAGRGLVIKSQADSTLFTFLDNGNFQVGTSTAIGSDRRGYFSSLTSISGASHSILVLNDTGATSAATSSTYLSFQHNGTEFSWLGHYDSASVDNSWLYLSAPDRVYFYNGAYYHYRKDYSASNRGVIINNIGSAEAEYNGVSYDSVVIAQSDVPAIRLRETLHAQELTFATGNEHLNASTIGATGRLVFATNRTAGWAGYTTAGAAMVIDTSGNVGIGLGLSSGVAVNPSFTLDVERDTDTWVSRIYNTGSDADAQGLLVRSDATSAHGATVFAVYANSAYKLRVKSSGVTDFNLGGVTVNADNTINWGTDRGRLTWDNTHAYVRGLADHGLILGGDNSTAITIDGLSGTTATFANTTYWSSVGIVSWGSGGFALGNSYGMRAQSGYALSLGSNGSWDYLTIDTSGNVYENSNRLRGYRTGTLTAAANVNYPVGWYRVAATPIQAGGYGARSAFKVRIYTAGGYFGPGTLEAKCFKNWADLLHISSVETSGSQFFTKVRLVADVNTAYFEVYLASAINIAGASTFQVEVSMEGLSSGQVLPYTENLVAGLSSPTYTYEMETRNYSPSLAVANLLVRDDLFLPSGGIIYFNGQTSAGDGNYNINGNSGYFDTLNSGYNSDALELCYYRGSHVTIGTGTYGSKHIRATEGVFTSASDSQLQLRGTDNWAGIRFADNVNSTPREEYLWYNGGNKTFALGGGGSNVANKKLHVDGGMTVGAGYDTATLVANQIRSQGGLQSDNAIQINYTGNGNNGSDACLHILHNSADWKIKTEGKVGSTYYDYGISNHGAGSYAYYQTNSGTVSARIDYSGNAIFSGNVTAYGAPSDLRLKENIDVIENALDKVTKLRGVTFNYKKDGSRSTGLIAQELLEVLPEAVYEPEELNPDDEKFYAVRYGNTVGLLVEAIKELKAENDELKAMMQKILDKEK